MQASPVLRCLHSQDEERREGVKEAMGGFVLGDEHATHMLIGWGGGALDGTLLCLMTGSG